MKQAIAQFLQEKNITFEENNRANRFLEILYKGESLTISEFELDVINIHEDGIELKFCDFEYGERSYRLDTFEKFKIVITKLIEINQKRHELNTLLEEYFI